MFKVYYWIVSSAEWADNIPNICKSKYCLICVCVSSCVHFQQPSNPDFVNLSMEKDTTGSQRNKRMWITTSNKLSTQWVHWLDDWKRHISKLEMNRRIWNTPLKELCTQTKPPATNSVHKSHKQVVWSVHAHDDVVLESPYRDVPFIQRFLI